MSKCCVQVITPFSSGICLLLIRLVGVELIGLHEVIERSILNPLHRNIYQAWDGRVSEDFWGVVQLWDGGISQDFQKAVILLYHQKKSYQAYWDGLMSQNFWSVVQLWDRGISEDFQNVVILQ